MSFLGAYKHSKVSVTIYHIPSKIPNAPLLVMIPGNPGIVDFYINYLNCLHHHFGFETLCISHINQDPLSLSNSDSVKGLHNQRIFTLNEQISSKIDIIKNFLIYKHGNVHTNPINVQRNLYILSHSVGSFMTQRIINDLNEIAKIKLIGLLFPTILNINESKNGIVFTKCFNWVPNLPVLIGYLSLLISHLPTFIINFLISLIVKPNNLITYNYIKKLILNPLIIVQVLGLAKLEMSTITNDNSTNKEFFSTNLQKWVFFAKNDHWINNNTKNYILNNYGNRIDYEVDNAGVFPHSFVVNHSEDFAKVTINAIERIVD